MMSQGAFGMWRQKDKMIAIVTDKFIPKRFDALALAFCILVRPGHEDDKDLMNHEWRHIKDQWAMGIIPYFALYFTYKPFRRWAETRAMKAQGLSREEINLKLEMLYRC